MRETPMTNGKAVEIADSETKLTNSNNNNNNNNSKQSYRSAIDSDLETQHTSSDTDYVSNFRSTPDVTLLLQKMEAINRANEQDSKSVSGTGSRKSNDSSDSHSGADGNFQSQLTQEETEDSWTLWGHLIKNWETEVKKRPHYIRELVRRGIPCHFRAIAWQLLSNASGADQSPATVVHELYAEYMRGASPHEKVIRRDVSRTFPEHDFFREAKGRGQTSLFNVMKAYSLHDKEVGYCQGSAFIAGLLLLQMPEEEAFAVLLKLMETYRLRELYKPAMTELGLCMFQLECLVQETMPDLFTHFRNMGLDTSMYASSWFLTLFATQMPLELSNRIMDVFISEGMEMVFRIALALLQLCRYELLQLDMEGMIRCFQRDLAGKFDQDYELLMTTAYNIKYNHKRLKKLEKDYLTKKVKEQEEAVELRRLRTENRLLRQRVEYLEQESSALADRLIERQVHLAQESENCVNVKHEFYTLREMNADTHRKLEQAYETIRELTNKAHDGLNDTGVQVDDQSMIEHIHSLQRLLMEVRAREADNENTIRDLKNRIYETETANKRLKETPPDHCIAGLQEELIAVKMREAEANLSLKEMRQKITDLQSHFEKYVAQTSEPQMAGTGRELQDQLMGALVREAESSAELKEMRQRVMELETLNHVCTNQIRRQDHELKQLASKLDDCAQKEKEDARLLEEAHRKRQDQESQFKEQSIMAKLRETELLTQIAEYRDKIADFERKKCEKWTQDELNKSGDVNDDDLTASDPPSPTNSNADLTSISSERDFAAYLVEMAVRVPPEAKPLSDNAVTTSQEAISGVKLQ